MWYEALLLIPKWGSEQIIEVSHQEYRHCDCKERFILNSASWKHILLKKYESFYVSHDRKFRDMINRNTIVTSFVYHTSPLSTLALRFRQQTIRREAASISLSPTVSGMRSNKPEKQFRHYSVDRVYDTQRGNGQEEEEVKLSPYRKSKVSCGYAIVDLVSDDSRKTYLFASRGRQIEYMSMDNWGGITVTVIYVTTSETISR